MARESYPYRRISDFNDLNRILEYVSKHEILQSV